MLITGLVFILKSVISTLGVVLGGISYALGGEVGLANGLRESDGNLEWLSRRRRRQTGQKT